MPPQIISLADVLLRSHCLYADESWQVERHAHDAQHHSQLHQQHALHTGCKLNINSHVLGGVRAVCSAGEAATQQSLHRCMLCCKLQPCIVVFLSRPLQRGLLAHTVPARACRSRPAVGAGQQRGPVIVCWRVAVPAVPHVCRDGGPGRPTAARPQPQPRSGGDAGVGAQPIVAPPARVASAALPLLLQPFISSLCCLQYVWNGCIRQITARHVYLPQRCVMAADFFSLVGGVFACQRHALP